MAEHVWTVLCQKAPIDKDTNDLSLQSVIEELTLHEVPEEVGSKGDLVMIGPFQWTLVSLWTRSDVNVQEEALCRYLLVTPDGQKVHLNASESNEAFAINLQKSLRLRVRLMLQGLPYFGPGMYYYKVQAQRGKTQRWTTVATIPLRVVVKLPETPGTT